MQRKCTLGMVYALVFLFILLPAISWQDTRAAEAADAQKTVRLEWASGAPGGMWYLISAGIAQLIKDQAPHIEILVVPGAGTENTAIVGDNQKPIGFGMPNLVMAAVKGRPPYPKKYEGIRGIATGLGYNYYHLIAAEDTGVKTFEEFVKFPKKDIRIDVCRKGSSGENIFNDILTGYLKSSYDAYKADGAKFFFSGYSTISTNMKDKHINFTSINIIPPASIIQELSVGRDLNILAMPEDLRHLMNKEYGYGLGVIKKESYPKILHEDVPTITTGTMVMCHESLDEDVAYAIAKVLCENKEYLVNIDKNLELFSAEKACLDMPVPLHPGAERYYREKGYLK